MTPQHSNTNDTSNAVDFVTSLLSKDTLSDEERSKVQQLIDDLG